MADDTSASKLLASGEEVADVADDPQQMNHDQETVEPGVQRESATIDDASIERNECDHPKDAAVEQDAVNDSESSRIICPWWTRCTDVLHRAILVFVVSLAQYAARHPWTVVMGVSCLSVLLMAIGLATNFVVVYDPEEFLIPFGTPIEEQYNWIAETFSDSENVYIGMLLHENGDNVITVNTTRKVLELMDAIVATPGYAQVCSQGDHVDIYGQTTCWSYSVARFWDYNISYFDATMHSDLDVMKVVSQATFPYGGTPVAHEALLGNIQWERVNGTKLITFAQSYSINIELPYKPGAEELEYALIDKLYGLRQDWSQLSDPVQLEFLAQLSLEIEVERAIRQDLPLLPVVFLIMSNFCSVVFFRRDKIKSRWLLGYGAVITIVCSLLTGFGIMFIAGVPVSSMLLVLPFIIFGIGLDDTFIITGAFFRTEDTTTDIVARITETMQDIGLSITLTTITTTVAFILSSLSTIRAVRWLGWYATITIFIDFIYQITFYVALVVLDERRIQARRRDVCFWIVVPQEERQDHNELATSTSCENGNKPPASCNAQNTSSELDGIKVDSSNEAIEELDESTIDSNLRYHKDVACGEVIEELDESTIDAKLRHEEAVAISTSDESIPAGSDGVTNISQGADEASAAGRQSTNDEANSGNHQLADRLMIWYARKLVPQRWFQVSVCLVFLGYFALCCHRTTLLRQEFRTQDFVPDDSYVTAFIESLMAYMSFDYMTAAYFRGVNQSDPAVQEQMKSYIDDLAALSHVGADPPFCWVQNFPSFQILYESQLENMTITEQISSALSIPAFNEIYGPDIIFDNSTGEIIASRCWILMKEIDMNNVQDQIEFYEDQNEVSVVQPINEGRKDVAFFSFEYIYFVWEFYAAIERELINSTISGVVAVGVISILLIPHWSAICFVLPLIIILYIDVMGTIQMMGLYVDSMTFVCIIVSVGLLVDFLMHVLLRYYESPGTSRVEKVQQTLTTIGASIFVGGLSTLLGVLPLSIGTSMVVRTVFLCFFAMVTLGLGHGLVLLPVVLCLVGPFNKGGGQRSAGELVST